jgi:hypothetical protein
VLFPGAALAIEIRQPAQISPNPRARAAMISSSH